MPVRNASNPSNPAFIASMLLALRRYAESDTSSLFARETSASLSAGGTDPAVARRLVDRFDKIKLSSRLRVFGEAILPTAPPPPDQRGGPRVIRTVTGRMLDANRPGAHAGPGENDEVIRPGQNTAANPTYTIRYRGVHCGEESDWDRGSGSDEIYVVTVATHIQRGETIDRRERHPSNVADDWYGDVDTNETRIGPVAAVWFGFTDIMSVTTVVFEHDEGDPDYYRDEVETIVKAAFAVAKYLYPVGKELFENEDLVDAISNGITWLIGSEDDTIETIYTVLELADLERYSRTRLLHVWDYRTVPDPTTQAPWDTKREWYDSNLEYHFTTKHRGGGSSYVVAFDVVRDPALPIIEPEIE